MAAQYQLVMQTGPNPGKVFALSKNQIVMGRDIECDISINDVEVSRNHTRLILGSDTYSVEDMGSTNGTYVNEEKISGQQTLNGNDVVRMGDNVTMVFEIIDGDPLATKLADSESASPPTLTSTPPATPPAPPQTSAPQAPPPQAQAQEKPPQGFAGQTPASPPQPAKPDRKKIWLIGAGVIFVIGFCVVSGLLYYIDVNFLWCNYFGWFLPGC